MEKKYTWGINDMLVEKATKDLKRNPELIICCGLMGCGKTTFAKEVTKLNYEYIDFDHEYHFKIQREHSPEDFPHGDIKEIIKRISNRLNANPNKNFIIDNWFKWHKNWWKDEEDNSLQQLKEQLKFHNIKIIHISIPFKKAYEGYMKKNKPEDLIRLENYKDTMKERYKNLNRKIYKWVTQ